MDLNNFIEKSISVKDDVTIYCPDCSTPLIEYECTLYCPECEFKLDLSFLEDNYE